MTDIDGWKVIDWRYSGGGNNWLCSLIQPDGTLYDPEFVGGLLVNKKRKDQCFVIHGYNEAAAKKNLRSFIINTQKEMDRKTKEPESFTFSDGGVVTHDLSRMKEELVRVSDDLIKQRHDLWDSQFTATPDPATKNAWAELNEKRANDKPKKSLYQEWKEKRMARKAAKSPTMDDGTED